MHKSPANAERAAFRSFRASPFVLKDQTNVSCGSGLVESRSAIQHMVRIVSRQPRWQVL